jgi:hypothetical protein
MKKQVALLALFWIVVSCGVKQTRELLTSGDYDATIRNSVSSLQGNKNAKGKQEYIYMLEEAFAKAQARDEQNLKLWKKEGNPKNLETIYNTYVQLNYRQEQIKPLLPLTLLKDNRTAAFAFEDYTDKLVSSKNAYASYLYDNSKALLLTADKMTIRRAYEDLQTLDNLSPGYKNVAQLLDEAKKKGTDYVLVSTQNDTQMVLPKNLETDLMDFSTYGLNDAWTVYHSTAVKGMSYDYGIKVTFRSIVLSPEQVKEKQFEKEKQIKDGTKDLVDAQGHTVKDSLGHPIKVDQFKTIKVSVYEYSQIKSCQVTAKVDYMQMKNNQLLDTFPLSSEFVFSNVYASYKGDKRACEEAYYPNFDKKVMPFPTNEQMVYDTGTDLKAKLKDILVQHHLRK